jgi:bacteriocin-like protein
MVPVTGEAQMRWSHPGRTARRSVMNTGENSKNRELTTDELNQVSGGSLSGVIAAVENGVSEAVNTVRSAVFLITNPPTLPRSI